MGAIAGRTAFVAAMGVAAGMSSTARAAQQQRPTGTSRVVVHGVPQVESVRVRTMDTFRRGNGMQGEALPTPRMLDPERLQLGCPAGSACAVNLRTPDGDKVSFEVFAMDPEVVVDLDVDGRRVDVSYRDADSRSATMSAIATDAHTLADACEASPRHAVTAAFAQRDLLRRARDLTDPLMADVAMMALAEGRCVAMPEDDEITEAVLDIDATAAAVAWWPGGLVDAAARVEPTRGWAKIDAAVASLPRAEQAGTLLFVAYMSATESGDADARSLALARLRVPSLSRTHGRRAAEKQERFRARTR